MRVYQIFKKTIFYFLFTLVFASLLQLRCKEETDNIPVVAVNFYVDLNQIDFLALNSVGNATCVTGGYKGIIIYHYSIDQFLAYERACPYDPECGYVTPDKNNFLAIDNQCCKSEFSLSMDGIPTKGAATTRLRQYKVVYYPNDNRLHITNF